MDDADDDDDVDDDDEDVMKRNSCKQRLRVCPICQKLITSLPSNPVLEHRHCLQCNTNMSLQAYQYRSVQSVSNKLLYI